MENFGQDSLNSNDIINIMVATDIHLGYQETDPVRGEDSFIAFEEVLSLAVQHDVDMILLGGDLFDQAKPSPNCLLRCTHLLRRYCLGERPVALELLSDPNENFTRPVNYEEPDLNVAYPVFTIHGNHDDPVGAGAISSLDILASAGLINYFGKWTDYTHVRIAPVLLRKGVTTLALYGLGFLKDQRLSRLFKDSKVEMQRFDADDVFSLLVLHQNRADRGPGNYISENVLPDFLDMVVWGHEHDCRVIEEFNEQGKFFVTQPGSTIATSLASGESLPKHCALLQIHKNIFKLTPIPLQTVRPFIFRTIVLSEEDMGRSTVNESEKVQEFLKKKVFEAIEEAHCLRSGDQRQPTLPLIRLSVFYEHEGQNFNKIRFGQQFNETVANPQDVLLMKRERRIQDRKSNTTDTKTLNELELEVSAGDAIDLETLILSRFEMLSPEQKPVVLCPRAVADAVREFTRRNKDDILRQTFDAHRRLCVENLLSLDTDAGAKDETEVIEQLRRFRASLDAADNDRLREWMKQPAPVPAREPSPVIVPEPSPEPANNVRSTVTRSRGRGGGRGGRPRGGRGARGARDRSPEHITPSPSVERRTPRRAAAERSSSWLQQFMSSGGRAPHPQRTRSPIEIDDSD
ncbi:Double-strand break repair protein MRE11 [Eumeta japonica]|uniref:Double-strand break repair protein n=1 Tax=Eumeta variegata TaxID=151549 RepID=A0A4C1SZ84_EUMVA|nr:Double-strand break repair protein MRE11 [Eumeta japonica]